jgi:hypothetical protein
VLLRVGSIAFFVQKPGTILSIFYGLAPMGPCRWSGLCAGPASPNDRKHEARGEIPFFLALC